MPTTPPIPRSPRVHRSVKLGTTERIILWSWSTANASRFANLVRLGVDGETVWTAALPDGDGGDCFNWMAVEGDSVFAKTWSGYDVHLSLATGERVSPDRRSEQASA